MAALVVGALLIALYKETTTRRTDRAAASIAGACDAIVRESRSLGETDGTTANTGYAAAVSFGRSIPPTSAAGRGLKS